MLTLQHITYAHPDRNVLFSDLSISVNRKQKIALIGNNGSGKSTLLKIISGSLKQSSGSIKTDALPYYVPQHFGQYNGNTVAYAMQAEDKIRSLREILNGNVTSENIEVLNDNWNIEEDCRLALNYWGLEDMGLFQKLDTLSGGQKTKVFLAGLLLHNPEIALLDEPTNHMDADSRELLYDYIRTTVSTLFVVSHDRTLLNLLDTTCVLTKTGITTYGGNYDFYLVQKNIETNALIDDLKSKEKELRKAREIERETIERSQKLDARGRKKQEKAGMPKVMMNVLKNSAEKSTSRIRDIHNEKITGLSDELDKLRKELPGNDKMKIELDDSALHKGKILIEARDINFAYDARSLWRRPLSFQVTSGQRLAVKGANGSGKTTLIRILLGQLEPVSGTIRRTNNTAIYIDQDYSLIDNNIAVYEQAQLLNTGNLDEYLVKSRLTHFLFNEPDWGKPCSALSGGEKMRLILCCLTLQSRSPDIIVLDEPTNNLDIQNIEILTNAVSGYKGTLVAISHDAWFLEQINVTETMEL